MSRRHPDYANMELPANTKVVEIFAKGVGVAASKRVEVINTTEYAYDVVWRKHEMSNSENSIKCDPPIAMVSSGKKHFATFTYTPKSLKTVETLWEFSIPSMDTTVHFLTVGRIIPH